MLSLVSLALTARLQQSGGSVVTIVSWPTNGKHTVERDILIHNTTKLILPICRRDADKLKSSLQIFNKSQVKFKMKFKSVQIIKSEYKIT